MLSKFGEITMRLSKFTKDPDSFKTVKSVTSLPLTGEEKTLYKVGDMEYVYLNGEWVYFIAPVFIPPIQNRDFRPDPSNLAHGTCVMDLETMDVYVVLDGRWKCFPMNNFISDEVLVG